MTVWLSSLDCLRRIRLIRCLQMLCRSFLRIYSQLHWISLQNLRTSPCKIIFQKCGHCKPHESWHSRSKCQMLPGSLFYKASPHHKLHNHHGCKMPSRVLCAVRTLSCYKHDISTLFWFNAETLERAPTAFFCKLTRCSTHWYCFTRPWYWYVAMIPYSL